jgi:hypothetical protein
VKDKDKKKDGDKVKGDNKIYAVEDCKFCIFGKLLEYYYYSKYYFKGGFCYWCNPWRALNNWKPKVNRIKELDALRNNTNTAAFNNGDNSIINPIGGVKTLLSYNGFFNGVGMTFILYLALLDY